MERIPYPFWGNHEKIQAITRIPEGPANALLALERFSNISVARIALSENAPAELKTKMQEIRGAIDQIPLAWVLCNAGGYRSPLVANYLVQEGLASLSRLNLDGDMVIGCGRNYLDYGIGISNQCIFSTPRDSRPLDVMVLNLSVKPCRSDRQTMTSFALMLEQGIQKVGELKHSLFIIWLEGIEDEYQQWFEDKLLK